MFYKYPYTNLYNLNLDWLIQSVKELQEIVEPLENVVTSVNGMTGDVELTREILTQILGGMVSKFNGRDGDVTLTAEDVNGTLIDITWTSDPGDTIDDLTQTELDALYTSGKRILIFVNNLDVADQVYFLQYYDNHAMPQEYSPTAALAGVATFNGQTGNVTATGADLATSETDSTTIAANLANLENTKVPNTRTVNNQPLSTNVSINAANVPSQAIAGATDVEKALGNLNNSKVPNTRTVNNQPLSANISINAANVPSQAIAGATDVEMALGNLNNSKVPNARQVNGKSLLNDITLNDEDIPSDVDGKTTVEEVLSYQSRQINDLETLAGNTTLPTTAQTLTGAIAELKASKLPYFSQFERLTTPIPHDGTIYEYIVPEDGYYAAIATNSSVEGICFAFFLNDADSSSYISVGYAGTGSYIRASTAYLPLKQDMRIYIRCNSTSNAYLMKGVV